MVSHEIVNATASWQLYNCDQITCDLSNWFAELLFGVIIGLGILVWQTLSHRNRSNIFARQIFDEVIPMLLDLSRLINSTKYGYDGKEDDSKLSDSDFHSMQVAFTEIRRTRTRIQERLDASGMSLTTNMQEETQDLVDRLANSLERTTDRKMALNHLTRMLFNCLDVCKESRVSKKDIKKRLRNLNTWIAREEEKQKQGDEFAKWTIEGYAKTKNDLLEILKLI